MFTTEGLIENCCAVLNATNPEGAITDLVKEAVSDRARVMATLGQPEQAGFVVLHRSPELTILDFTWAPWMTFKPHNHCMWSVVGILSGGEDNVFWRRVGGAIEAAGARSLREGDVTVLGREIIHSVVNPIGKMTRAIHAYGGDFFAPPGPRSEWNPETLVERPWDIEDTKRLFAAADARARQ